MGGELGEYGDAFFFSSLFITTHAGANPPLSFPFPFLGSKDRREECKVGNRPDATVYDGQDYNDDDEGRAAKGIDQREQGGLLLLSRCLLLARYCGRRGVSEPGAGRLAGGGVGCLVCDESGDRRRRVDLYTADN